MTTAAGQHPFAKTNFLNANAEIASDSDFQFTWLMPKKLLSVHTKVPKKVAAARTSLRKPKNASAARKFSAPAHWETWLSCETACKNDHLIE